MIDAATLDRAAKEFRAGMWSSACEDAVDECGIAERRFGPVQANLIETLPDAVFLNSVLGAAEPGAVEDGHLAEAIEWADSFYVDYRVQVGHDLPGTAAAEAWLDRHGFEQGQGLVRYARSVSSPPELPGVSGVRVWEIGGPGEEDVAGETMIFDAAQALGMPPPAGTLLFELPARQRWRCYTAEVDEEIVSFGSMLVCDEVAALGLDATFPSARRRGCNLALLRERLLAAHESGCGTIFSSVPAYGCDGAAARNLVRAGFVPAHRCVSWQRPRGG